MSRFLIAGVIVASSFAVLAGCAIMPHTTLASPETGQAEPLRIEGALTYRERIALPPQSRAQIELREGTSGEGAVVAEQAIELGGRQIPIPFELAVSRDKLVAGRQYSLLGQIVAKAGPNWTSQQISVDTATTSIDLGTLVLVQARHFVSPARLRCGERFVSVDYSRAPVRMIIGGESFELRAVPAASGAKHEASGDSSTTLWNKGASTTLVVRGKAYPECSPAAEEVSSARGNDPATLLHGAWVVEEIDSTGIIEGPQPTLNFSAEGRVSGKASCNSRTGKYVLGGEGLSVGPTASTIMACDPRLTQQEQAFLAQLETIRRFELAADGALLLISEDQSSIRARRI
jgi:putative lipoprotein